jgi:GTP-binding protein HflX
MSFLNENTRQSDVFTEKERALLVGLVTSKQDRFEVEENIEELASLATTAGAEIVDMVLQERDRPDSAHFIGRGKAAEIADRVSFEDIHLIIFDDELSPVQVKNLESLTNVKVIDRAGLILDIFAAHARTREARTQVELAQLNYYLPRLTRQWSHLSRQVGGIGTKGPGETQLETDRRLIRTRISYLKRELEKIEKQKTTQRQHQEQFFRAALVGYTNVGKSTILNRLTDADVLIEDKLFATLDTTTRRLEIRPGMNLLLSDTVGFIRKLPHHLVASFRSTLAQAIESDVLLHVVDLSHPAYLHHIDVVMDILKQMEIEEKPVILIFNKVDRVEGSAVLAQAVQRFPEAIFVSARKNIRLEKMKLKLYDFFSDRFVDRALSLTYKNASILPRIEKLGHVLDKTYTDVGIDIHVRIHLENEGKLERLLQSNH